MKVRFVVHRTGKLIVEQTDSRFVTGLPLPGEVVKLPYPQGKSIVKERRWTVTNTGECQHVELRVE